MVQFAQHIVWGIVRMVGVMHVRLGTGLYSVNVELTFLHGKYPVADAHECNENYGGSECHDGRLHVPNVFDPG